MIALNMIPIKFYLVLIVPRYDVLSLAIQIHLMLSIIALNKQLLFLSHLISKLYHKTYIVY